MATLYTIMNVPAIFGEPQMYGGGGKKWRARACHFAAPPEVKLL
jgi:hypothetical protein